MPTNYWLRSVIMDNIWQPGVPMEGDVRGHFGVHAFTTKELALQYGASHRCSNHYTMWVTPDQDIVCGQVSLWGEVVQHERGYRASFAKIAGLDSFIKPSSTAVPIEQLRLKYKV